MITDLILRYFQWRQCSRLHTPILVPSSLRANVSDQGAAPQWREVANLRGHAGQGSYLQLGAGGLCRPVPAAVLGGVCMLGLLTSTYCSVAKPLLQAACMLKGAPAITKQCVRL
jgi:hypothetical protein